MICICFQPLVFWVITVSWGCKERKYLARFIKPRVFLLNANQVYSYNSLSFLTEEEAQREGRWCSQSLQPWLQGNQNIPLQYCAIIYFVNCSGFCRGMPYFLCLHFTVNSLETCTAVFALAYTSGVGWVLLMISITLFVISCFNHLDSKSATVLMLCEINACSPYLART